MNRVWRGVFRISFRSGLSSRRVVVEEEAVSEEEIKGIVILEFERDRACGFWDCR